MKTICMLSDMHPLFDDRIYWKECISLKKNGFDVVHIGFDTKETDFISEEGIRIISIKKKIFSKNLFLHKIIKTLLFDDPHRNMMKHIRQIRADVYHIHDLKVNKLGRKIRKLSWKPKIIYDVHEDYGDMIRYYTRRNGLTKLFLFLYAEYTDYLEKRRTAGYDQYIHVTEYIQEKFRQKNPGIETDIIFNFTNFHVNPKYPTKKFDLIHSGTISHNRGVLSILRSLPSVIEKFPDLKVLFLGNFSTPDMEAAFKVEVQKLKLEKCVLQKDYVPHDTVPGYYEASGIGLCLLLPIKKHFYSIAIKLFEYMAFGLPVIGSNFGYTEKFIRDSGCGTPVDPENPEEISDAIIRILENKEMYDKMSRAGMEAVKNSYNWDSQEKKLISIYKKLLFEK